MVWIDEEKINLKALKALIKPFKTPQRSVKIKFELIFTLTLLFYMLGTRGVKKDSSTDVFHISLRNFLGQLLYRTPPGLHIFWNLNSSFWNFTNFVGGEKYWQKTPQSIKILFQKNIRRHLLKYVKFGIPLLPLKIVPFIWYVLTNILTVFFHFLL